MGARCHVQDHTPGSVDSHAKPPQPNGCGYDFQQGRVTFWYRHQGIETCTELVVLADDPVELRRVVVTNHCDVRRTLSATSYAEIVLPAPAPATDSAHPAFSKLFVQTEIDPVLQAIFATRRPSTPDDPTPWFFHLALISGSAAYAFFDHTGVVSVPA